MRARIHFLRGNLHFPRGNIEGCLAEHQKSLELARADRLARAGGPGARRTRRCGLRPRAHDLRPPAPGTLRGACRAAWLGRHQGRQSQPDGPCGGLFPPLREVLGEGSPPPRPRPRSAICAPRSMPGWPTSSYVHDGRSQSVEGRGRRGRSDLVQRLGARRFLQSSLPYVGKAALLEGRPEAVSILREDPGDQSPDRHYVQRSEHSGPLALALSDPSERRQMLAQGEAIIRQGMRRAQPAALLPGRDRRGARARRVGRGRALRRGARRLHSGGAPALVRLLRRARPGARRSRPGCVDERN